MRLGAQLDGRAEGRLTVTSEASWSPSTRGHAPLQLGVTLDLEALG